MKQARIVNPNNLFHGFPAGTLVVVGVFEYGDYDCTNIEEVVIAEEFYGEPGSLRPAGNLSQWVPANQLEFI